MEFKTRAPEVALQGSASVPIGKEWEAHSLLSGKDRQEAHSPEVARPESGGSWNSQGAES